MFPMVARTPPDGCTVPRFMGGVFVGVSPVSSRSSLRASEDVWFSTPPPGSSRVVWFMGNRYCSIRQYSGVPFLIRRAIILPPSVGFILA